MPNKKESLSIIAVKTLLAVIIFVGIGTVVIGQGYLIGKQKNDKLNKILPSICKDSFNCPSQMKCKNYICVDVGCIKEGGSFPGAISPKYTNHMATECCEGLKVIRISRYYDEDCNDKDHIVGGSMSTCSNCGNGICEKNLETKCNCPEDCPDKGIIITTDKTEYKKGEIIKITVKNNSDEFVWYRDWSTECGGTSFSVGKRDFGEYENQYNFRALGLTECMADKIELKPKATRTYILNLKEWENVEFPHTEVNRGVYKWRLDYTLIENGNEKSRKVRSKKFMVMEKLSDSLCDKKARGIGDCNTWKYGYEYGFDFVRNVKGCFKTNVRGCSFEMPFDSMEKCQEVCEKSEQIENERVECDDSNCETCTTNKGYTILKKGSCGEILAVKSGDMENSILEAVILKEENQFCKTLFSLNQSSIRNSKGEILVSQAKAEFGYLFRIREEKDYWFFDLLMLDDKGKPVSDIVILRWDSNKCDYTVEAAGGY